MLYLSDVANRDTGKWKLEESLVPKDLTNHRIIIPDTQADINFACDEGFFTLSGVNNNCGMVYLSGMGKYNGSPKSLPNCKPLIEFGVSLAKSMGYTKVFYTLSEQQEKLEKDLLELGWKEIEEMGFTNLRTGNSISVLTTTIEGE
jgi:hypothetical protein